MTSGQSLHATPHVKFSWQEQMKLLQTARKGGRYYPEIICFAHSPISFKRITIIWRPYFLFGKPQQFWKCPSIYFCKCDGVNDGVLLNQTFPFAFPAVYRCLYCDVMYAVKMLLHHHDPFLYSPHLMTTVRNCPYRPGFGVHAHAIMSKVNHLAHDIPLLVISYPNY